MPAQTGWRVPFFLVFGICVYCWHYFLPSNLKEFTSEATGPQLSLWERFKVINSIFSADHKTMELFLFASVLINSGFQGIFSFPPICQMCWHKVVCDNLIYPGRAWETEVGGS